MKLRDGHCDTLGPPFLGHRVTQCLTQGYTVKITLWDSVPKFSRSQGCTVSYTGLHSEITLWDLCIQIFYHKVT